MKKLTTFEKLEPLSAAEVKKIKNNTYGLLVFLLFALSIFGFAYNTIDEEFSHNMFLGFGAFFTLIILFFGRSFLLDLKNGKKIIATGVVRLKERSTTKGTNSSNKTTYYITIADKRYTVDRTRYAQANEGDLIELHYAPLSKINFDLKVLQSASFPSPDEVENTELNISSNSTPREPAKDRTSSVQMRPQDMRLLKELTLKSHRMKLFTLLFMSVIIAGFMADGMTGILLIFFPIPIVTIVMVFKLIIAFTRYQKEISQGRLTKTETHIKSRDNSYYKRSRTYYIKTTSDQLIKISKNLYEKVQAGKAATLYTAPITKQLLYVEIDGERIDNI